MRYVFGLFLTLLATLSFAGPAHYVCWDGTTAKNARKCPPYKLPLVCPDGSIVSDPAKCPPVIVCLDGSVAPSLIYCPPPVPAPTE